MYNENEIFNKASVKDVSKIHKEIAQNYVKILKGNFTDSKSQYDENYVEDGLQISKYRNFKVVNNISYDKESKSFKFKDISDELKEVFLACGIKKKDLETDMEFAFNLLKRIIVGLGTENKLKNTALEGIKHNFIPPSEIEKLLRQEEVTEAKLNIKKKKKKPPPKPKAKPKPMAGKRGSVPLPPPPPLPPSTASISSYSCTS